MIFAMIGGYLFIRYVEKKTTEMLTNERLKALREDNPELVVVKSSPRVYLSEEQKLIGEGGDLFLFHMEAPDKALAIVSRERDAAEALGRKIYNN